jgi:hypothetical protein
MVRLATSGTPSIPWIAIGILLGVTVECALILVSPLVAIGVNGLLAGGLFIYLRPATAALVLAFLTALFPKAGIKAGGFPFPIFLFGLLIAVGITALGRKRTRHAFSTTWVFIAFLGLMAIRALMIVLTDSLSDTVAFLAWSTVPITMLYVGTQQDGDDPNFRRAIELGFIVAVGYALIQLFFGVERVAIQGLTYAYGDDLSQKHNLIYSRSGEDFSKIPSTYQNGNIFGLVAAVFFALALARIARHRESRLDYLLLVGAVLAIGLSGSRTAVLAALAAFFLTYLSQGAIGRKIAISMVIIAGIWVVLTFQPGLLERYSVESATAGGGSGRLAAWGNDLRTMTPFDFLFGTGSFRRTEGWLGVVQQIGFIGIGALVFLAWRMALRRPYLDLPLLVLFVGAIIDSSYQFFPTWFLLAALAFTDPASALAPSLRVRMRPRGPSTDAAHSLRGGVALALPADP